MKTKEEVKELLAKSKPIIKKAEISINQMKVKLQKFNGDKTEPKERIDSLDALVNLSIANQTRIDDLLNDNAKLLIKIGELNHLLKKSTRRLVLLEKISESSVEEVTRELVDNLRKTKI